MSEILAQKQINFDPQIRRHDDISTWCAEVLDGSMKSKFSYHFNGEDLIARDGGELKPVFDKAQNSAVELVEKNPALEFELRRREIEMGEYEDMLAMAKGEGTNTMITVSDFPAELMNASKDLGGYNVTRRQTMLRVITRNDQTGLITMSSQSLDQSNRWALEAIYDFMDEPVERGELLGQRIYREVEPEFQAKLSDTLTSVYDNSMAQQKGGVWHAGRQPADYRNTFTFVTAQQDLLRTFLAGPMDDEAKINLAAALEARWEGKTLPQKHGHIVSCILPAIEMEIAGRQAKLENKTYSGCGGTLTAENELNLLGFGNQSQIEEEKQPWYGRFKKKGKCEGCGERGEVGERSWCETCIGGHCGTKKRS